MSLKNVERRLDYLLSELSVKTLKDSIEKANNTESLKIVHNKDKNTLEVMDLEKAIDINDIIEFEEQGIIQKAVVTAKGKRGVTARDRNHRKVQLYYQDILDHTKRAGK